MKAKTRLTLTIFQRAGGMRAFQGLATAFYARVGSDPRLKQLFPADLTQPRRRMGWFLAEQFGGPRTYSERRGRRTLQQMHAAFPIESDHVRLWLRHMHIALKAQRFPGPVLRAIRGFVCGHAHGIADPLGRLLGLPPAALRARLRAQPGLVDRRDLGGATLLHRAAMTADAPRARVLLAAGAAVDARDALGHTPLSRAVNHTSGLAVVRLLLRHGADVNARCGPTAGTPLHTAARRDNVAAGRLLLAARARTDTRDRKGATPLQRARNCRQPGMIALLGRLPIRRRRGGR